MSLRDSASKEHGGVRLWPILVIGFSTLLFLIGASGWLSFERSRETYSAISEMYTRQHAAQESLSSIRSDISQSAILLRDYLLNPDLPPVELSAKLASGHDSARASIEELRHTLPASTHGRLKELETDVDAYWASLTPLPSRASHRLWSQIVPRREAAYALLPKISELSFQASLAQQRELDERTSELARFLFRMIGLTILTAFVVAAASLYRVRSLESIAKEQRDRMQQAEDELRDLSHQLVTAQEQERRALSRDLHDQVGQLLTALRISIGNTALLVAAADSSLASELELSKRLVTQALRTTRDIAMGLRPAMLDDLGLEAALEWHARQHSKLCGVPVSVAIESPLVPLSDEQKICVYRVVQEALNNSAKYAAAQQIAIDISLDDGEISIEVRDDGVGFDPSCLKPGLGILGMRERVAQLGGRLTVESEPNKGTVIRTRLPIERITAA